jgi:hypothetical protein
MPPREFRTPRDKREELKTYRELELGRGLKSARRRRRLQATGAQRVLGDGSTTQPFLVVETARYRQVRLEVQRRLLLEARQAGLKLPLDRLLEQLRPRIESLTYGQLARESDDGASSHVPVAALGRALTAQERIQFAASRNVAPATESESRKVSGSALDRVLGRIELRQAHNPARYQTLWAQVVGPEVAQQTHLERVDAATQTAYFRGLNSVLSSDLQRRPGLAQQLARALGVPVRRLRAQF